MINIEGLRIISTTDECSPLVDKVTTIIFEMSNEYFYFYEDSVRMGDITKMPTYIKIGWVEYNKIKLTDRIINQEIKKFELATTKELTGHEEVLKELKQIRELI